MHSNRAVRSRYGMLAVLEQHGGPGLPACPTARPKARQREWLRAMAAFAAGTHRTAQPGGVVTARSARGPGGMCRPPFGRLRSRASGRALSYALGRPMGSCATRFRVITPSRFRRAVQGPRPRRHPPSLGGRVGGAADPRAARGGPVPGRSRRAVNIAVLACTNRFRFGLQDGDSKTLTLKIANHSHLTNRGSSPQSCWIEDAVAPVGIRMTPKRRLGRALGGARPSTTYFNGPL